MRFHCVHNIPHRQRWRTSTPMTQATAEVILKAVHALPGIDGVTVNPRTRSLLVSFSDPSVGRQALYEWLVELENHPAILDPSRRDTREAYFHPEPLEAGNAPAALPIVFRGNPIVDECVRAMREGVVDMPVLEKFREWVPGRPVAKPEHEFTFGGVARYAVIGRFLPLTLNIANTCLGAVPILVDGVKSLFKGEINVDVLDAIAVGISIVRRDWMTASLTILLMSLSEMLENYARKKSVTSLAEALSMKVDQVWVQRGPEFERLEHVPLSDVTLEDRVVVRTGNVIPVDGIVVDGVAEVNQATMTGESVAVHREKGGTVFAGTVVEEGDIVIRPTQLGDGTRLAKIIQFVEDSEGAKAQIESRATKFADAIVPFNLALAGLVFFLTRDLNRTAAVLMVDYSCAIRLATPLSILAAMREGTNRGALVKGGRYLEALSQVDTVVFDKTGTLTQSVPTLKHVVSLDETWPEEEILRLAACLEEHFPHPVSRAVVKAAQEQGLDHFEEAHDTQIQYVVAHGIVSTVDGERTLLGSRHFVEDDEKVDCSMAVAKARALAEDGNTILYIALGGKLIGLLGIEDPLRVEAQHVVRELQSRGMEVVMLTGDDHRTAAAVAHRLGITRFESQVLPHQKAEHVQALKEQGRKVLMMGDGINDSPALSTADVGVTLKDSTDIAQEVADVVLTERLDNLLLALDLGKATMTRVQQNVALSVGLNSVFLAGGLFGVLTPIVSSLLHNASTIGICGNALRPQLGRYEGMTPPWVPIMGPLKDLQGRAQAWMDGTRSFFSTYGAKDV